MTDSRMKVPGKDHPITIERNPARLLARFAGVVIADTVDALTVREANFAPVQYIPRKDVDLALLRRTEGSSHCPYKGDAGYFGVVDADGRSIETAWCYEAPYPAVERIAGHIAFYREHVEVLEGPVPAGAA